MDVDEEMSTRGQDESAGAGNAGSERQTRRQFLTGTAATVASASLAAACQSPGAGQDPHSGGNRYDLVNLNGGVIDPETGLDAICNVGIRGDKIAAVTEDSIQGKGTVYTAACLPSLFRKLVCTVKSDVHESPRRGVVFGPPTGTPSGA